MTYSIRISDLVGEKTPEHLFCHDECIKKILYIMFPKSSLCSELTIGYLYVYLVILNW